MSDENSKKSVIVDDKCIGCGICVTIASEVFEMDESGISKVKEDVELNEENMQKAKEAAEACPVGAIIMEEE